MTIDFDPYVTLGVSAEASADDIKRAYRQLAQRLHPDRNPHAAAEKQFQALSNAYDVLSNPSQRRRYDRQAADDAGDEPYFTLTARPSKQIVAPLSESQIVYMLADITADPRANIDDTESHTANLNLTLVLDRSKSMDEEGRMDEVRMAAQAIVNELDADDFISVVTFNDHADTIIEATPVESKKVLRSRLGMIRSLGGTEIYPALREGVKQNRKYLAPKLVNHIILLTDGRTYGDEDKCLALAEQASKEGITISAIGLGTDWNDQFLDNLVQYSGGTSIFIESARQVTEFMNEHVRVLSNAFAERVQLLVAPDPDVTLEMAFKLSPSPQPLSIEGGIIPLASLPPNRPIALLLQFQLPSNMPEGFRTVVRMVAQGDILESGGATYRDVSDISLQVKEDPPAQKPPTAIIDALSKLTLYHMQEKAQAAIEDGDYDEATRRLEKLATRLFEQGESQLAKQTMLEAQNVSRTKSLSKEGSKKIKYETRALLSGDDLSNAITGLLTRNINPAEDEG